MDSAQNGADTATLDAPGPIEALRILRTAVDAGHRDPDDPAVPLILTTGPLTGVAAPGTARVLAIGLSPLSGGVAETRAEGPFGAALVGAGAGTLVLTGRADRPSYLVVRDGTATLHDARHLWGLGTAAATDALADEYGAAAGVAVIGPAGERGARYASVVTARHFPLPRLGFGAVFGARNLKAVVCLGDAVPSVADPAAVADLAAGYAAEQLANPLTAWQHDAPGFGVWPGTVTDPGYGACRNYSDTATLPGPGLAPERFVARLSPGGGCPGCPTDCVKVFTVAPRYRAVSPLPLSPRYPTAPRNPTRHADPAARDDTAPSENPGAGNGGTVRADTAPHERRAARNDAGGTAHEGPAGTDVGGSPHEGPAARADRDGTPREDPAGADYGGSPHEGPAARADRDGTGPYEGAAGRGGAAADAAGLHQEAVAALGPNLGIEDAETVLAANARCQDLGLDPVSLGGTLGCLYEAAEAGLTPRDWPVSGFGDDPLPLIELTATGTGELAELLRGGADRLAAALGAPRLAMTVRGVELPPFEPRVQPGLALAYAIAPTGPRYDAVEHDLDFDPDEGKPHSYPELRRLGLAVPEPARRLDAARATRTATLMCLWSALDALAICPYASTPTRPLGVDRIVALVRAVTGRSVTVDGLLALGGARLRAQYEINLRLGLGPGAGRLPDRMHTEPVAAGRYAGAILDRAAFTAALGVLAGRLGFTTIDEE